MFRPEQELEAAQCEIINRHLLSPPATQHVSVFKQPLRATCALTCAHVQTSRRSARTHMHTNVSHEPGLNCATHKATSRPRALASVYSKVDPWIRLHWMCAVCATPAPYQKTLTFFVFFSSLSVRNHLTGRKTPVCLDALLLLCGLASVKVSSENVFRSLYPLVV